MRIWETRESRKIGKLKIGKPKETGNSGIEGGKIRERRTKSERIGKWKIGNAGIEAGTIRERRSKKQKDREMENGKCWN